MFSYGALKDTQGAFKEPRNLLKNSKSNRKQTKTYDPSPEHTLAQSQGLGSPDALFREVWRVTRSFVSKGLGGAMFGRRTSTGSQGYQDEAGPKIQKNKENQLFSVCCVCFFVGFQFWYVLLCFCYVLLCFAMCCYVSAMFCYAWATDRMFFRIRLAGYHGSFSQ